MMSPANSRRRFLFKVALLIDGAVGAVLAVPIVGYILGPSLKKDSSYNAWVSLGAVSEFPEGETRLVDYRNPVTAPWDGQTGNVACWVRRIAGEQFQIFAINCAHLGCPGPLVRTIETFPVPLPRRRLLCGRIPRLRAAPARSV